MSKNKHPLINKSLSKQGGSVSGNVDLTDGADLTVWDSTNTFWSKIQNNTGWFELSQGGGAAGFYMYNTGDVGLYDTTLSSGSTQPVEADSYSSMYSYWKAGDWMLGRVGYWSDFGGGSMNGVDNWVHGGHVGLRAQDAAGATIMGLDFDPDIPSVTIRDSLYINEIAAAAADVAAHGQLWVKNTTPCQLWFTDDAGNDTQIV